MFWQLSAVQLIFLFWEGGGGHLGLLNDGLTYSLLLYYAVYKDISTIIDMSTDKAMSDVILDLLQVCFR